MSHPTDDSHAAIGAAVREAADRVQAPPELRARLDAMTAEPAPRHRRVAVLGMAGGVALVVAVVVALLSSTGQRPSVAGAAEFALAKPTQAAPAVDTDIHHIRIAIDGVRFPNYAYRTKWATVGARADRLEGRDTTTVIYRNPTATVGYTIVAGKPLAIPSTARRIVAVTGLPLAVVQRAGATIVTWRRAGHTCVLASRDASLPDMVRLATWA